MTPIEEIRAKALELAVKSAENARYDATEYSLGETLHSDATVILEAASRYTAFIGGPGALPDPPDDAGWLTATTERTRAALIKRGWKPPKEAG